MDKLYIVMPAYNEQDNIEQVVLSWYQMLEGKDPDSKIVVADSGSEDATHDILFTLKKNHPQLVVLSETQKQHGPKLMALYDYAFRGGADYVFQTDSDGQTLPEEFERFWELRKCRDAVIGYRPYRGDGRWRAFVEKVVCLLLHIIFGINVPDANAPYRLIKIVMLEKYLDRIPCDYNLPNIMLTTYFKYYEENIEFIEITFKNRHGGRNSINVLKILKIGWNALGDFYKFRKEMIYGKRCL